MAELFTEEDVRRYGEKLYEAPEEAIGDWFALARVFLSALAEDGRLRTPQRCTCPDIDVSLPGDYARGEKHVVRGLDPDCPEHMRVVRADAAEPGGALPSDTPALAADSESNP